MAMVFTAREGPTAVENVSDGALVSEIGAGIVRGAAVGNIADGALESEIVAGCVRGAAVGNIADGSIALCISASTSEIVAGIFSVAAVGNSADDTVSPSYIRAGILSDAAVGNSSDSRSQISKAGAGICTDAGLCYVTHTVTHKTVTAISSKSPAGIITHAGLCNVGNFSTKSSLKAGPETDAGFLNGANGANINSVICPAIACSKKFAGNFACAGSSRYGGLGSAACKILPCHWRFQSSSRVARLVASAAGVAAVLLDARRRPFAGHKVGIVGIFRIRVPRASAAPSCACVGASNGATAGYKATNAVDEGHIGNRWATSASRPGTDLQHTDVDRLDELLDGVLDDGLVGIHVVGVHLDRGREQRDGVG